MEGPGVFTSRITEPRRPRMWPELRGWGPWGGGTGRRLVREPPPRPRGGGVSRSGRVLRPGYCPPGAGATLYLPRAFHGLSCGLRNLHWVGEEGSGGGEVRPCTHRQGPMLVTPAPARTPPLPRSRSYRGTDSLCHALIHSLGGPRHAPCPGSRLPRLPWELLRPTCPDTCRTRVPYPGHPPCRTCPPWASICQDRDSPWPRFPGKLALSPLPSQGLAPYRASEISDVNEVTTNGTSGGFPGMRRAPRLTGVCPVPKHSS